MTQEKYVIKNDNTGQYIGMDQTSGGYPYDTEIEKALIWYDKDEAFDYKRMFPREHWSLHIINFESTPTSWI